MSTIQAKDTTCYFISSVTDFGLDFGPILSLQLSLSSNQTQHNSVDGTCCDRIIFSSVSIHHICQHCWTGDQTFMNMSTNDSKASSITMSNKSLAETMEPGPVKKDHLCNFERYNEQLAEKRERRVFGVCH